jgi:hypothetical protein
MHTERKTCEHQTVHERVQTPLYATSDVNSQVEATTPNVTSETPFSVHQIPWGFQTEHDTGSATSSGTLNTFKPKVNYINLK